MTVKARKLFEDLAPDYDERAFGSKGLAYVSRLETAYVRETLDVGPGTRLLEVGVGTGRNMKALAPHSDVVVGADISPGMMREARAGVGGGVQLLLSDLGEGLPFRDGEFDRVLCLRVLKYIPNWPFALGELARVLKPGGKLIFDIANRRSISRISPERHDVHLVTVGELKEAAGRAGIIIDDEFQVVRVPYAVYARVQSDRALNAVRMFERAAGAVLPGAGLSRWVIFSGRRAARGDG
jgi:ubiquinone/menaquinone biosynthesis C-methylase UbiE